MVNPVGASIGSNDVSTPIEYREGWAVFERAQSSLLKGDIRFDVERRRLAVAGPRRNRLGQAGIDWQLRQRSRPPEPQPRSSIPHPRCRDEAPHCTASDSRETFAQPKSAPRSGGDRNPIERLGKRNRRDRFIDIVDDEAGDAVVYDFRY